MAFSFAMLLVTHELGHIIDAKWEGIFEKFGFDRFGNPYVRLKRIPTHRSSYLIGMLSSLVTWPFWIWSGLPFWFCPGGAFLCGLEDLTCFFSYSKIVKKNGGLELSRKKNDQLAKRDRELRA